MILNNKYFFPRINCSGVPRRDYSGTVFGRLTCIKPVDLDQKGQTKWECRCSCGKIHIVRICNLRNGHCKSCGCYNNEVKRIKGRKRGPYKIKEKIFNVI